jgi:hypothetical protein
MYVYYVGVWMWVSQAICFVCLYVYYVGVLLNIDVYALCKFSILRVSVWCMYVYQYFDLKT